MLHASCLVFGVHGLWCHRLSSSVDLPCRRLGHFEFELMILCGILSGTRAGRWDIRSSLLRRFPGVLSPIIPRRILSMANGEQEGRRAQDKRDRGWRHTCFNLLILCHVMFHSYAFSLFCFLSILCLPTTCYDVSRGRQSSPWQDIRVSDIRVASNDILRGVHRYIHSFGLFTWLIPGYKHR